MKFSDIEVLNSKFFGGELSGHLSTARTRITKLVQAGYLAHRYLLTGTNKKFYIATLKAFRECQNYFPNKVLPKPGRLLSSVTFEHDYRILLCRLALEEQSRCKNWKSERHLKAELNLTRFEREFMPDALFESRRGLPCAFELEYSPKTVFRYQAKVSRYVSVIEDPQGLFKNCLFVTSSKYSNKVLLELTAPYGTYFKVQDFDELLSSSRRFS